MEAVFKVKVAEVDKEKAHNRVSRMGVFEFSCMSFGLINASGVFQSLMTLVLEDLNRFALAYLDGILFFP